MEKDRPKQTLSEWLIHIGLLVLMGLVVLLSPWLLLEQVVEAIANVLVEKRRIFQFRFKCGVWKLWWRLRHGWRGGKAALSPVNRAMREAALQGNAHNVEVLLQRGADANLRLTYDVSLLSLVALKGHTEIVRLLLAAGADASVVNECTHNTPLLLASDAGHEETVAVLLEYGADCTALAAGGEDALLLAARKRHYGTMRLLLTAANGDTTFWQGYRVLSLAKRRHDTTMLNFLRTFGIHEDVTLLRPSHVPCAPPSLYRVR